MPCCKPTAAKMPCCKQTCCARLRLSAALLLYRVTSPFRGTLPRQDWHRCNCTSPRQKLPRHFYTSPRQNLTAAKPHRGKNYRGTFALHRGKTYRGTFTPHRGKNYRGTFTPRMALTALPLPRTFLAAQDSAARESRGAQDSAPLPRSGPQDSGPRFAVRGRRIAASPSVFAPASRAYPLRRGGDLAPTVAALPPGLAIPPPSERLPAARLP